MVDRKLYQLFWLFKDVSPLDVARQTVDQSCWFIWCWWYCFHCQLVTRISYHYRLKFLFL